MASPQDKGGLTGSLEDYLETIYLLLQDRPVARVRDIAQAREVKPGSVTPALKRLDELGLVQYVQREYVALTPAGEVAARRVFARHQLLSRFFHEVLQMPHEAAEAEACKLEHSLSNQGMDRLASFFEFLALCPHLPPVLSGFHRCHLLHASPANEPSSCTASCPLHTDPGPARPVPTRSLCDLEPGERARITCIKAGVATRRKLLGHGLLPDLTVEVLRVGRDGTPIYLKLQAAEICLGREEAAAVLVGTRQPQSARSIKPSNVCGQRGRSADGSDGSPDGGATNR